MMYSYRVKDNFIRNDVCSIQKKILKITSFVLCIILLVCILGTYAKANDNNMRFITNSQFCSYSYSSVAYGNNRYVAVGFSGAIKTSDDGVNWVKRESGTTYWLRRVIWSGKKFIAVGYGYSYSLSTSKPQTVILTSSDGLKWQAGKLTSISDKDIRLGGIAYNGKVYVAVGEGAACYSSDGVKWNVTTGISEQEDVVWANGKFISVGYDYTHSSSGYPYAKIAYSTDGIKWTKVNMSIKSSLNRIIWTGKKYIAVGRNGLIITSANGTAWQQAASGVNFELCEIAYNGKVCLASGKGQQIIYSKDLNTWKPANVRANNYIYSITWGMNKFIATGLLIDESFENFIISSDGVNWEQKNASKLNSIDGIGFDSDRKLFLVFLKDINGAITVLESSGGVEWEKYKGQYTDMLKYKSSGAGDIAYNGNVIIKVNGYMEPMEISSDGENWKNIKASSDQGLTSVIWTGQLFVAVGYNGNIMTSINGTDWIKYKTNNSNLRDIAFNGSYYVALGDCGDAAISEDGITWVYKRFNYMEGVNRVVWDGSYFIALGQNGVLYKSKDAVNWDIIQTPTGCDLIDIVSAEGKYLIRSTGDITIGG